MANQCRAFGCLNLAVDDDDGSCEVCRVAVANVVGDYRGAIQHVCRSCAQDWAAAVAADAFGAPSESVNQDELVAAMLLWAQTEDLFRAEFEELRRQVEEYKALNSLDPDGIPAEPVGLRTAQRAYRAAASAATPFALAYFRELSRGSNEQVARETAARTTGIDDPFA